MKEYIKNLFTKSEPKDDDIVVLKNKCKCGGKICYDKNSLKSITEQHSETDASCEKCNNDKFRVRVSSGGMIGIFNK